MGDGRRKDSEEMGRVGEREKEIEGEMGRERKGWTRLEDQLDSWIVTAMQLDHLSQFELARCKDTMTDGVSWQLSSSTCKKRTAELGCRRRRRRRRFVDVSTTHRRVVRRRDDADVTSGSDDVIAATDGESTCSLDRAFLANSTEWRRDWRGPVDWRSPVDMESRDDGRRTDDSHNVSQLVHPADSRCVASQLTARHQVQTISSTTSAHSITWWFNCAVHCVEIPCFTFVLPLSFTSFSLLSFMIHFPPLSPPFPHPFPFLPYPTFSFSLFRPFPKFR